MSGGSERSLRLAAAVACPALATVAGRAWPQASETFPVILYLLAVVGAAVLAGLQGGLVASFLSFLGLNFFFTPPVGTFAVEKGEDFVALFGFLAVSSLVATLLTKSVAERKRAERQEHEAWRLYQLSSRLLGGAKLRNVLQHLAQELVQLFDLASCEVTAHTDEADGPLSVSFPQNASRPSPDGSVEIPLATDRQDLGMVVLLPKQDHPLTARDRELAGTFVGQVALALERSRLEEATRKAQADVDASRMRAALFSSVTHDLRTPLASIKAAATSLLEEGVLFDAAQRMDLLQTITEESDRLNRLIGNLLDLSRLRAGALVPTRTPTPIEDVIEAVVWRLRKLLANHPVRIRVREDIPPVPVDLIQTFAMDELAARIRAALRRSAGAQPPQPALRFGDLEIDLARQLVKRGETAVHLTPTEYRLLEVMATNPGKLLTHRWLVSKVWASVYASESQNLRFYVRQLRKKLEEDPSRPRLILTEPSVGYRWSADPPPTQSTSPHPRSTST